MTRTQQLNSLGTLATLLTSIARRMTASSWLHTTVIEVKAHPADERDKSQLRGRKVAGDFGVESDEDR